MDLSITTIPDISDDEINSNTIVPSSVKYKKHNNNINDVLENESDELNPDVSIRIFDTGLVYGDGTTFGNTYIGITYGFLTTGKFLVDYINKYFVNFTYQAKCMIPKIKDEFEMHCLHIVYLADNKFVVCAPDIKFYPYQKNMMGYLMYKSFEPPVRAHLKLVLVANNMSLDMTKLSEVEKIQFKQLQE